MIMFQSPLLFKLVHALSAFSPYYSSSDPDTALRTAV